MQARPTSDDKLSPAKVAVLILIYLYLNEELPNKRQIVVFLGTQLEGLPIVHDNKLVLLSSLEAFCDAIEASSVKKTRESDDSERFPQFKHKFLTIAWDISSADLIQQLSMDAFRRTAEPLCVVALLRFQVSTRSPIGRFVRTMAASLKLLQFEESSELVEGFRRFRASTEGVFKELRGRGYPDPTPLSKYHSPTSEPLFETWNSLLRKTKRQEDSSEINGDSSKDLAFYAALDASLKSSLPVESTKTEETAAEATLVTIPDMDLLVKEQIRLLESFGTPTPDFLRNIIYQMATPHSVSVYNSMPSLHYLQYLENLCRGEYHEAFDSLHKYFDYMVSQGSKYFYHFALVSKASLHQHFGEDEEALDSMEEAISIARENHDNSTLTYILSWLYDFMRRKPALWNSRIFRQIKNELRLLDYLVKKSLSVSLSLAAVSYRFEVDYLLNGQCHFSRYYESLFKAGYFAIHDSVSSFIGVCHTSSNLWKNVGYPHLSQLYTELGLQYSKLHGLVRDMLMFEMGQAWCRYSLGDSDIALPDMKSSLELCNSNVAQLRSIRILLQLRQTEVALGKGRVRLAQELLLYLPESHELEQKCLVEKIRVQVLLKLAQGNYAEALICVSEHIGDMDQFRSNLRPDVVHLLELNLLKAAVLIQSGVPVRAFSLVLQQLEIANQLGLRFLMARGYVYLIQILNSLGQPGDALDMANSVLALVNSVGNIEIKSNLFFQMATSHHKFLESGEFSKTTSKTALFAQFLNYLSLAIAGFKKSVNFGLLVNSFELEDQMAATALQHPEIRNSKPFEDFRKHLQMGLDILRRRAFDECEYGYLRKSK